MTRDIGIRSLRPGYRNLEEVKEDENTKRYIETVVNQRAEARDTQEVDPLDETLVNRMPSINLELKPPVTQEVTPKVTKGFRSQRDYENYITSRARLKEEAKEARELRSAINTDRIVSQVDKMVKKYDGPSPSQEDTINQLNKLKSWAQPTPIGLGNKYKSDIRSPNSKKRDAYVAKQKWINDQKKPEAFAKSEDPTNYRYNKHTGTFRNELGQEETMMNAHKSNEKKTKWPPGAVRFAQDEADHLNGIKKQTYEQGGRVGPKPKYVSAQDIVDLHERSEPKATPLQEKKLHQRLRNHNERTGQFKNLPKEEELHPYDQYHEEKLIEIADKGKSITLPLIDPIFKKSAQPEPTKGARYIPWYERMGNKDA